MRKVPLVRLLALLVCCTHVAYGASATPVAAPHGMVVTAQSKATRVGVEVLKQNGNAIDAAVAVGYTLAEHWQPVVRVGLLDRDLDATGDGTWAWEGGLNWLVKGHNVKEQLAASYFHDQDGTSSESIVLASQIAF